MFDIPKILGQIKETGEAVIAIGAMLQMAPDEPTQKGEEKRRKAIKEIKEAAEASNVVLPSWLLLVLPTMFNVLIPMLKAHPKFKDFIKALTPG